MSSALPSAGAAAPYMHAVALPRHLHVRCRLCFGRYTFGNTPFVMDVSPQQGSALGGTPLVITGAGLSTVDSVVVNGVPCLNVAAVSDTQVRVRYKAVQPSAVLCQSVRLAVWAASCQP